MAQEHGDSSRVIRVLVVDDDMDVTDVLAIGLERQGFQVTGFTDSLKALAAASEGQEVFDVVVSDEFMPSLRGHELLRKLRDVSPSTKSILCSGDADTSLEAMARLSGADRFLRKPVSAAEVAAAIRSLMA